MNSLSIANFKINRTINKGAFAQVYEVTDTQTNRLLALKIVSLSLCLSVSIAKNGSNVLYGGQNNEVPQKT